ncbi:MAG: ATP-binding protein, partial [Candidatus Omnitrophota bacterium]
MIKPDVVIITDSWGESPYIFSESGIIGSSPIDFSKFRGKFRGYTPNSQIRIYGLSAKCNLAVIKRMPTESSPEYFMIAVPLAKQPNYELAKVFDSKNIIAPSSPINNNICAKHTRHMRGLPPFITVRPSQKELLAAVRIYCPTNKKEMSSARLYNFLKERAGIYNGFTLFMAEPRYIGSKIIYVKKSCEKQGYYNFCYVYPRSEKYINIKKAYSDGLLFPAAGVRSVYPSGEITVEIGKGRIKFWLEAGFPLFVYVGNSIKTEFISALDGEAVSMASKAGVNNYRKDIIFSNKDNGHSSPIMEGGGDCSKSFLNCKAAPASGVYLPEAVSVIFDKFMGIFIDAVSAIGSLPEDDISVTRAIYFLNNNIILTKKYYSDNLSVLYSALKQGDYRLVKKIIRAAAKNLSQAWNIEILEKLAFNCANRELEAKELEDIEEKLMSQKIILCGYMELLKWRDIFIEYTFFRYKAILRKECVLPLITQEYTADLFQDFFGLRNNFLALTLEFAFLVFSEFSGSNVLTNAFFTDNIDYLAMLADLRDDPAPIVIKISEALQCGPVKAPGKAGNIKIQKELLVLICKICCLYNQEVFTDHNFSVGNNTVVGLRRDYNVLLKEIAKLADAIVLKIIVFEAKGTLPSRRTLFSSPIDVFQRTVEEIVKESGSSPVNLSLKEANCRKDCSILGRVLENAGYEFLFLYFVWANKQNKGLIAFIDKEPAGGIIYCPENIFIECFGIKSGRQNRGFGAVMLKQFIEYLNSQAKPTETIKVRKCEGTERFFTKFGFKNSKYNPAALEHNSTGLLKERLGNYIKTKRDKAALKQSIKHYRSNAPPSAIIVISSPLSLQNSLVPEWVLKLFCKLKGSSPVFSRQTLSIYFSPNLKALTKEPSFSSPVSDLQEVINSRRVRKVFGDGGNGGRFYYGILSEQLIQKLRNTGYVLVFRNGQSADLKEKFFIVDDCFYYRNPQGCIYFAGDLDNHLMAYSPRKLAEILWTISNKKDNEEWKEKIRNWIIEVKESDDLLDRISEGLVKNSKVDLGKNQIKGLRCISLEDEAKEGPNTLLNTAKNNLEKGAAGFKYIPEEQRLIFNRKVVEAIKKKEYQKIFLKAGLRCFFSCLSGECKGEELLEKVMLDIINPEETKVVMYVIEALSVLKSAPRCILFKSLSRYVLFRNFSDMVIGILNGCEYKLKLLKEELIDSKKYNIKNNNIRYCLEKMEKLCGEVDEYAKEIRFKTETRPSIKDIFNITLKDLIVKVSRLFSYYIALRQALSDENIKLQEEDERNLGSIYSTVDSLLWLARSTNIQLEGKAYKEHMFALPIKIKRLIEGVVMEFKNKNKDIDFTIKGNAGLKAVIDFHAFIYVLQSLLENAVLSIKEKSAKPGFFIKLFGLTRIWRLLKKKVVISAKAKGDEVVIKVSDTGRGIKPDVLKNIFVWGFTERPDREGTGFALHTAKQIVEAHKGKIEAASKLEKGTTFTITIPKGQLDIEHKRVLDNKFLSENGYTKVKKAPNLSGLVKYLSGRANSSKKHLRINIDGPDGSNRKKFILEYLKQRAKKIKGHFLYNSLSPEDNYEPTHGNLDVLLFDFDWVLKPLMDRMKIVLHSSDYPFGLMDKEAETFFRRKYYKKALSNIANIQKDAKETFTLKKAYSHTQGKYLENPLKFRINGETDIIVYGAYSNLTPPEHRFFNQSWFLNPTLTQAVKNIEERNRYPMWSQEVASFLMRQVCPSFDWYIKMKQPNYNLPGIVINPVKQGYEIFERGEKFLSSPVNGLETVKEIFTEKSRQGGVLNLLEQGEKILNNIRGLSIDKRDAFCSLFLLGYERWCNRRLWNNEILLPAYLEMARNRLLGWPKGLFFQVRDICLGQIPGEGFLKINIKEWLNVLVEEVLNGSGGLLEEYKKDYLVMIDEVFEETVLILFAGSVSKAYQVVSMCSIIRDLIKEENSFPRQIGVGVTPYCAVVYDSEGPKDVGMDFYQDIEITAGLLKKDIKDVLSKELYKGIIGPGTQSSAPYPDLIITPSTKDKLILEKIPPGHKKILLLNELLPAARPLYGTNLPEGFYDGEGELVIKHIKEVFEQALLSLSKDKITIFNRSSCQTNPNSFSSPVKEDKTKLWTVAISSREESDSVLSSGREKKVILVEAIERLLGALPGEKRFEFKKKFEKKLEELREAEYCDWDGLSDYSLGYLRALSRALVTYTLGNNFTLGLVDKEINAVNLGHYYFTPVAPIKVKTGVEQLIEVRDDYHNLRFEFHKEGSNRICAAEHGEVVFNIQPDKVVNFTKIELKNSARVLEPIVILFALRYLVINRGIRLSNIHFCNISQDRWTISILKEFGFGPEGNEQQQLCLEKHLKHKGPLITTIKSYNRYKMRFKSLYPLEMANNFAWVRKLSPETIIKIAAHYISRLGTGVLAYRFFDKDKPLTTIKEVFGLKDKSWQEFIENPKAKLLIEKAQMDNAKKRVLLAVWALYHYGNRVLECVADEKTDVPTAYFKAKAVHRGDGKQYLFSRKSWVDAGLMTVKEAVSELKETAEAHGVPGCAYWIVRKGRLIALRIANCEQFLSKVLPYLKGFEYIREDKVNFPEGWYNQGLKNDMRCYGNKGKNNLRKVNDLLFLLVDTKDGETTMLLLHNWKMNKKLKTPLLLYRDNAEGDFPFVKTVIGIWLQAQKQMEEEEGRRKEIQAKALAQEQKAELSVFAENILHIICQLLPPVNISLSFLSDYPDNHRGEKLEGDILLKINRAVERSQTGLENFIKAVKEKSESFRIARETEDVNFDVRESIKAAIKDMNDIFDAGKIKVVMDIQEPLYINGSKKELKSVFMIICSNAAQAMEGMPEEEKRLIIKAVKEGKKILIEFENTGPPLPVPAGQERKVFESGFTTKELGTGLGLSVAYNLANKNLGSITAENPMLNGEPKRVRFTVILPALDSTFSSPIQGLGQNINVKAKVKDTKEDFKKQIDALTNLIQTNSEVYSSMAKLIKIIDETDNDKVKQMAKEKVLDPFNWKYENQKIIIYHDWKQFLAQEELQGRKDAYTSDYGPIQLLTMIRHFAEIWFGNLVDCLEGKSKADTKVVEEKARENFESAYFLRKVLDIIEDEKGRNSSSAIKANEFFKGTERINAGLLNFSIESVSQFPDKTSRSFIFRNNTFILSQKFISNPGFSWGNNLDSANCFNCFFKSSHFLSSLNTINIPFLGGDVNIILFNLKVRKGIFILVVKGRGFSSPIKHNILLIEDTYLQRESYKKVLEDKGDVTAMCNVEEALALLKCEIEDKNSFSVILSDYYLGRGHMTGDDFAVEARKLGIKTPIVIHSDGNAGDRFEISPDEIIAVYWKIDPLKWKRHPGLERVFQILEEIDSKDTSSPVKDLAKPFAGITRKEIEGVIDYINRTLGRDVFTGDIKNKVVEKIFNMGLEKDKTCLVAGPGSGDYLPILLAKSGLKISVIDIDEYEVGRLKSLYDLFYLEPEETINYYVSYSELKGKKFDYIMLLGVLRESEELDAISFSFAFMSPLTANSNSVDEIKAYQRVKLQNHLKPIIRRLNLNAGCIFINTVGSFPSAEECKKSPVYTFDRRFFQYLDEVLCDFGEESGVGFRLQPQIDIDNFSMSSLNLEEKRAGVVYKAEKISNSNSEVSKGSSFEPAPCLNRLSSPVKITSPPDRWQMAYGKWQIANQHISALHIDKEFYYSSPIEDIKFLKDKLFSAVGLAAGLDSFYEDSVMFYKEGNSNFTDTESVSSRGQVDKGFGANQRVRQRSVASEFFADSFLVNSGEFFEVLFTFGGEFYIEHIADIDYLRPRSFWTLANGIHPFSSASSIESFNDWMYLGLRGSFASISSISHPAGFEVFEAYSLSESRSTNASSITDRTSKKAGVSKIKSCGIPLLSTTIPALEFLLSFSFEAIDLVQATNLAPLSSLTINPFFLLLIIFPFKFPFSIINIPFLGGGVKIIPTDLKLSSSIQYPVLIISSPIKTADETFYEGTERITVTSNRRLTVIAKIIFKILVLEEGKDIDSIIKADCDRIFIVHLADTPPEISIPQEIIETYQEFRETNQLFNLSGKLSYEITDAFEYQYIYYTFDLIKQCVDEGWVWLKQDNIKNAIKKLSQALKLFKYIKPFCKKRKDWRLDNALWYGPNKQILNLKHAITIEIQDKKSKPKKRVIFQVIRGKKTSSPVVDLKQLKCDINLRIKNEFVQTEPWLTRAAYVRTKLFQPGRAVKGEPALERYIPDLIHIVARALHLKKWLARNCVDNPFLISEGNKEMVWQEIDGLKKFAKRNKLSLINQNTEDERRMLSGGLAAGDKLESGREELKIYFDPVEQSWVIACPTALGGEVVLIVVKGNHFPQVSDSAYIKKAILCSEAGSVEPDLDDIVGTTKEAAGVLGVGMEGIGLDVLWRPRHFDDIEGLLSEGLNVRVNNIQKMDEMLKKSSKGVIFNENLIIRRHGDFSAGLGMAFGRRINTRFQQVRTHMMFGVGRATEGIALGLLGDCCEFKVKMRLCNENGKTEFDELVEAMLERVGITGPGQESGRCWLDDYTNKDFQGNQDIAILAAAVNDSIIPMFKGLRKNRKEHEVVDVAVIRKNGQKMISTIGYETKNHQLQSKPDPEDPSHKSLRFYRRSETCYEFGRIEKSKEYLDKGMSAMNGNKGITEVHRAICLDNYTHIKTFLEGILVLLTKPEGAIMEAMDIFYQALTLFHSKIFNPASLFKKIGFFYLNVDPDTRIRYKSGRNFLCGRTEKDQLKDTEYLKFIERQLEVYEKYPPRKGSRDGQGLILLKEHKILIQKRISGLDPDNQALILELGQSFDKMADAFIGLKFGITAVELRRLAIDSYNDAPEADWGGILMFKAILRAAEDYIKLNFKNKAQKELERILELKEFKEIYIGRTVNIIRNCVNKGKKLTKDLEITLQQAEKDAVSARFMHYFSILTAAEKYLEIELTRKKDKDKECKIKVIERFGKWLNKCNICDIQIKKDSQNKKDICFCFEVRNSDKTITGSIADLCEGKFPKKISSPIKLVSSSPARATFLPAGADEISNKWIELRDRGDYNKISGVEPAVPLVLWPRKKRDIELENYYREITERGVDKQKVKDPVKEVKKFTAIVERKKKEINSQNDEFKDTWLSFVDILANDPIGQKLFADQIWAIFEAYKVCPNIRFMPAMVKNAEDIKAVKQRIKEIIPEFFDSGINIGSMIEVKSAFDDIENIAKEVDFLSIGSNDLQRETKESLNHNEIVGMFDKAFKICAKYLKELEVCGDAACDPESVSRFINLQDKYLKEFGRDMKLNLSMPPISMPFMNWFIAEAEKEERKK